MKSEREFMDSVLEKTEKAEKAAGIRRRKIFTGAGIAAALHTAPMRISITQASSRAAVFLKPDFTYE